MIVAAGTADAQAEKDLAGHVGDLVEDVGPLPAHVALVVFVRSQPQIAGGDCSSGSSGSSSSPASCSVKKRS